MKTVYGILLFSVATLFAQSKTTFSLAVSDLSTTGTEIAKPVSKTDSVIQVKEAIKKNERWTRRIAFGIGTAVACGTGLYFNSVTSDAYNRYKSETSVDPSIHGKNWKEYEKNARIRNAFYIASGILGAGFVISIPF